MPSDTAYVSIAGILTAGLLGPAASALWTRWQQKEAFKHEHTVRREEDVRKLLDEAAVALAGAVTRIREAVEQGSSAGGAGDLRQWAGEVHELSERMVLRLDARSETVRAYEEARAAIAELLEDVDTGGDDEAFNRSVDKAEAARSKFLDAARGLVERLTSTELR
jgi:hypothetical protein